MRPSKDYILLDWDGCLAKTLDVWLDIYKDVVKKRGIEVTNDLEFVEKTFDKWQNVFEEVGVKDSLVAYEESLQSAEVGMKQVDLYPNARELLQSLKSNGKKIALLTSSFRRLVIPAIERHNLQDYFDLIITKDETEKPKPDPWLVKYSLEKLGGTKDKAVIMGDSDHDMLLAKYSGVTSVMYYPEHNKVFYREELVTKHQPDYIINDLLKLLDII